jgi:hypothetical protein
LRQCESGITSSCAHEAMSPLERLRKSKAETSEISDGQILHPSEHSSDNGSNRNNERPGCGNAALISVAEKLKPYGPAERANLEATYLKFISGEAAKWEEEKLVKKGLIEAPANDAAHFNELPYEAGMSTMAAALQIHFAGKLPFEISRQRLMFWRKGEIPKGAPVPPVATGNGAYRVRDWAQWIQTYILPGHSIEAQRESGESGSKASIFEEAQIAEAKRKIIDLEMATLDKQVATGAFQSADLYRANLRFAGTVVNSSITNSVEKRISEKLIAVVAGWQLGQEKELQMKTEITKAAQEAADAIRADAAKALTEATEKIV